MSLSPWRPSHPHALALSFALVLASPFARALQQEERKGPPLRTLGRVERLDRRLDAIVPKDATLEVLAEGFDWSEGPVWTHNPEEGLLFSDVPQNTVFLWTQRAGVRPFLKPSGYTGNLRRGGEPGSNGLLLDQERRLILCQHGDRRVARFDGGQFVTLADRFEGKRFNSPNDAVYRSNGDLYFTDPPYGLPKGNDDPAKEIPFSGVYRVARDGTVTLLTREMSFPNGIGFSPDEKTLYVANSDPKRPIWMAFPVKDDGTLSEGKVFFDASTLAKDPTRKGLPDGLKLDMAGNLFATGPGGVLIFHPDGTHLGTLLTGEATANCGWGNEPRTALYITADMYLLRINLDTTPGPRKR